jgi:Calcineurin-like phosphoesterase
MDQVVLVQLADSHLCDTVQNDQFGIFPGFWGHHHVLAIGLSAGLKLVYNRTRWPVREPLHVVFNGDLVTRGLHNEFVIGHTYLYSRFALDCFNGRRMGLGLDPRRVYSVPGNHDHWNGWDGYVTGRLQNGQVQRLPPAFNSDLVRLGHVPATPWKRTIHSTQNGILLELYGVDSNSGLSQKRTNQRASGGISHAELTSLDTLLRTAPPPPSGTHRVRALVCHHGHHLVQKMLDARPLHPRSLKHLVNLCAEHEVSVLLTGHQHTYGRFKHVGLTRAGAQRPVVEIRAPTPSQGPPTNGSQGFLAHQIHRDATGAVHWDVWMFNWLSGRFVGGTLPIIRVL